ncbi:MAG: hypothetical protein ACT4QA_18485 [Panacagrimonas sp.]
MKQSLPALLLFAVSLAVAAAPLDPKDVPEPLKPWVPWVLQGYEQSFCPPAHDDTTRRLCVWPAQLALDLDAGGGRFELSARTDTAGWLLLPGERGRWPQDVSDAGLEAPVLLHENRPALFVSAGEHRVQGRFEWSALPESLRVPPDSGLVRLAVNGKSIPHPERDEQHQLWLGRRAAVADTQAESLDLRVFRLIDDAIPLTVTTRIELDAGGEVREETIGPALLAGLVPLSLSGDLPARIEDDGRLRVQVRPGSWALTVVARSTAPVTQLSALPAQEKSWAPQEVWSFQAHHDLRVVEAGGAAPVDPRQVGVPGEWQNLPAFLLEPGATLKLDERQRGSGDVAPDELRLSRQLWLDFDGRGFTMQDRLNGRLSRTWRLEAASPLALGQVMVDGEPQLITQHGEGIGVEVRHGTLSLIADSRVGNGARSLPAGGWNTDLQGVDTTLHLPPAWRLLAAPGADNVPDTWLSRWTLLDLFLVLVASIAALRLFGRGTAALTLVMLGLTWHEPGAPQWSWLNLIAALALLRVLPASFESRLRRVVEAYRWVAVAVLAFVALPFFVQQARLSLYPQLENGSAPIEAAATTEAAPVLMEDAAMSSAPEMQADSEGRPDVDSIDSYAMEGGAAVRKARVKFAAPAPPPAANVSQTSIQRLDPNVLTQTGPGLPNWNWRQSTLSWSGPVTPDQSFTLWLMPPWLTRLLGWLSIVLIALVAVRWLGLKPPRSGAAAGLRATSVALAAFTLVPMLAPTDAQAQGGPAPPDRQLLEELRGRLLAPADCATSCASWSRLTVNVREDRLLLRLLAEAEVDTALPLPVPPLGGQGRIWQPETVLLDERAADLVRSDNGQLWLRVPAGRHTVAVSGGLAGFAQVQLPLPLAPQVVSLDTQGWSASGVDAQGRATQAIDLARERGAEASAEMAEGQSQTLPPLLVVTRTLRLGLDWRVESSIERIGNAQGAFVATVPALPTEVVTIDSVRRVGATIQASFAPGQTSVEWTSRLDIAGQLTLTAPDNTRAFEVWRFDVSPLWHIDFEGIPEVSSQDADWRLNGFRPWPGETVKARISRPVAVTGQVLTLDRVSLAAQPGKRATDYTLSLALRASQGGQHALPLAESIALQSLSIDGVTQPARREGGRVILPLHPGAQSIELQLRTDEGLGTHFRTPELAPGLPGVNAELSISLPADRWVLLTGGPQLGPAVLFWGVLAVLLIVAFALGRSQLTPLKSAQWTLLMIGLSQLPLWGAALVAGWLFALALRARAPAGWSENRFNLMQIGLALWTFAALATLFGAVAQGLLGTPDMQIAGNGSTASELRWFQDRFAETLPRAWVLSVSIWFYRGLMLLWALWLANSLLNWLRWGWEQFSAGGLWRRKPLAVAAAVVAPPVGPGPVSPP